MAVVRELTKRHEEIVRGTVRDCLAHFEANPPQGEFCLVVEGSAAAGLSGAGADAAAEAEDRSGWWNSLSLAEHVSRYEAELGNRKEAMRLVARDRGMSRREVYRQLLQEEE